MFEDEDFSKLCHTKGIWFKSLMYFISDSRLSRPMSQYYGIDDIQDEPVFAESMLMCGAL
jgi:hypothetical protein